MGSLKLNLILIVLLLISCSEDDDNIKPLTVTFPDPKFETLIRETLDKPTGDITPEDMLLITELNGLSREISDIRGIDECTNLVKLGLSGNQIIDISPLSGLTNMTSLWLEGNQIIDISPLSGLIKLEVLDLLDNGINDISPLLGLTNLEILILMTNGINDIKPLVDNIGINQGDTVDLSVNPLNEISINTYIPELRGRGVNVLWP